MAWNTTFTRFYSSDLAGLECGNYLKIPRRDRKVTKIAQYTGVLEVGQCVGMFNVPAGARITGAKLSWHNGAATVLGVGDPYACGRLLGPVVTSYSSGINPSGGGASYSCLPWGVCGTMTKTGANGDGCGLFYQYTCETMIQITNLYSAGGAAQGGFLGGGIIANTSPLGVRWAGGDGPSLVLEVEYLQSS